MMKFSIGAIRGVDLARRRPAVGPAEAAASAAVSPPGRWVLLLTGREAGR